MPVSFDDWDSGKFRSVAESKEGRECFSLLSGSEAVAAMIVASELGHPALVAVEHKMLERLGAWIIEDRPKQMAGAMVRFILENAGLEVDKSNVTVASQPFSKATRYRWPDRTRIHAFRSTSNPRDICLTGQRTDSGLPMDARWRFWATITSRLQASIAYGVNDYDALVAELSAGGYRRITLQRVVRSR